MAPQQREVGIVDESRRLRLPVTTGEPAAGAGATPAGDPVGLELVRVARGDEAAFARLYDLVAPRAYGMARRVVRDPAQAEEVVQEVLLEVWRSAARYEPDRGSGIGWILTLAHRRAVDRVRQAQAATDRERRAATATAPVGDYDQVAEQVTDRLEHRQVRHCLGALTDLQREVITLAYYQARTYRQVADLLHVPLPTVKTRMRDGLIKLRDCLGAWT
jgi:RNA polymerase sigma-70 factor (ECF subfamily)